MLRRYRPMKSVAKFHRLMGVDAGMTLDGPINRALVVSRRALLGEEYQEAIDELDKYIAWAQMTPTERALAGLEPPDVELLAKELADLLYVTYGCAERLGIPLEDVFREVHRSNMSKLGRDGRPVPVEGYPGKFGKGPDYRPADVHGVLTGEWL